MDYHPEMRQIRQEIENLKRMVYATHPGSLPGGGYPPRSPYYDPHHHYPGFPPTRTHLNWARSACSKVYSKSFLDFLESDKMTCSLLLAQKLLEECHLHANPAGYRNALHFILMNEPMGCMGLAKPVTWPASVEREIEAGDPTWEIRQALNNLLKEVSMLVPIERIEAINASVDDAEKPAVKETNEVGFPRVFDMTLMDLTDYLFSIESRLPITVQYVETLKRRFNPSDQKKPIVSLTGMNEVKPMVDEDTLFIIEHAIHHPLAKCFPQAVEIELNQLGPLGLKIATLLERYRGFAIGYEGALKVRKFDAEVSDQFSNT